MSENSNIPPFAVGQKVVCISDTMEGFNRKVIKKGEVVSVRKAYGKCVFFNEVINPPNAYMSSCDDYEPAYATKNFAPIETQYTDISKELAESVKQTDEVPDKILIPETAN